MTTAVYEEIGRILTMDARNAATLLRKAKDRDCPMEVCSAALDQYAKVMSTKANAELEAIYNDYSQPEELRVIAGQWLRTLKAKAKSEAVPCHGAVRTRGRVGRRRREEEAAAKPVEPSARLSWLERLSD